VVAGHLNHRTVQKKMDVTIAAVSIVVLLSAAVVVPSWNAFADSHDIKSYSDKSHQKGPKGADPLNDPLNEPQRCLHGASAKYNKHCF